MATKKKATPKRKAVRVVVTASRDVLLRSALSKAEAERDHLKASLTAEREQHLSEELDLQKVADNNLHKSVHLEGQIDVLAKMLVEEFGGPTCDESACEMAARLLREQRDKIAKLEAKLEAERQPRMYRTIPSYLPYNRSEVVADSATKYTREVGR